MLQEFSHWLLLLIATDAVEALCPISRDVRGKGRNDAMIIAKARKRVCAPELSANDPRTVVLDRTKRTSW